MINLAPASTLKCWQRGDTTAHEHCMISVNNEWNVPRHPLQTNKQTKQWRWLLKTICHPHSPMQLNNDLPGSITLDLHSCTISARGWWWRPDWCQSRHSIESSGALHCSSRVASSQYDHHRQYIQIFHGHCNFRWLVTQSIGLTILKSVLSNFSLRMSNLEDWWNCVVDRQW